MMRTAAVKPDSPTSPSGDKVSGREGRRGNSKHMARRWVVLARSHSPGRQVGLLVELANERRCGLSLNGNEPLAFLQIAAPRRPVASR